MGKIRTVKPEIFKDEDLFDLEMELGLPARLAFIGLFTTCDREGRFKWKPRTLKSYILPYDELDFSILLDGYAAYGLVIKYENQGELYGSVVNWNSYQRIRSKEARSELPSPDDKDSNIFTEKDIRFNFSGEE